jgi:hypothetical protein
MKQRLWNNEYSRTKIHNNIMKVWRQCLEEDKFDWYAKAHEEAVRLAGHDQALLNKACGVVAALSPRMSWDRNLVEAKAMWTTGEAAAIGQFKEKARAILRSDGSEEAILAILNGQKISSFYLNIRYPDKAIAVTIDRHHLSICLGRKLYDADLKTLSVRQYEFLVECTRWTAARLGVSPLLVQSATWVRWRQMNHSK